MYMYSWLHFLWALVAPVLSHSQARLPDYVYTPNSAVYMPMESKASHYLKQWFSPSNSYVQIQPLDGAVVPGHDVTFNVSQTVEANHAHKLFYQVCALGMFEVEREGG